MDAASALADLTEISSQVEAAVVLDADGSVLASTLDDAGRTETIARAGTALLEAAVTGLPGAGRSITQLEAALREGSFFLARDGERSIVATTTPQPTSGLVFYDLKTCLRSLGEEPATEKKQRRPAKKEPADA